MRKVLIALALVFVVGMLGIIGWYVTYTNRIESQLEQYLAESKAKKLVKVDVVVTPPANTPADQMLYVSGSVPALGAWDAAGVPLQRRDDGAHAATVEVLSGVSYAFKVTRGTWGTVECAPGGKDVPNRELNATGEGPVEVTVAAWIDEGKSVPGRVTMTGDIRVHRKFPSKVLGNERNLVVFLPPGYEQQQQQRYPVLYMQDGQNLFDEATSFNGIEWKLDEAAQRLMSEGKIPPTIIVGIYNTETRTAEFTPPGVSDSQQARGGAYAQMVVTEVKPFIDRTYRTETGLEHTGIGGASMGGLISIHILRTHGDVFGRAVLLSPWLRQADGSAIDWGDGAWARGKRLYIDMGTNPGGNYPAGADSQADAKALTALLDAAGLKVGQDYTFKAIEGGTHNEPAFAARIEQVLLDAYGASAGAAPTTAPATAPVVTR